MARREWSKRLRAGGRKKGLPPPLSDLVPIPPGMQRTVWTIEPAEELDPAAAEMWQRIGLTARLVKHPTSGDVKSFGEFVGGYAAAHVESTSLWGGIGSCLLIRAPRPWPTEAYTARHRDPARRIGV